MEEIYVVYSADAWLMTASKEIIGVCTDTSNCISVIQQYIKKNDEESLSDDDMKMLDCYNQTQGRQTNFIIEELEMDVLL